MKDKRVNISDWIIYIGMICIFVVFTIICSALGKQFLTLNNVMNIINQASINAVVAIGASLVILTGGIDLSVGSVVGFVGIFLALRLQEGMPIPVAIILCLVLGAAVGLFNTYQLWKGSGIYRNTWFYAGSQRSGSDYQWRTGSIWIPVGNRSCYENKIIWSNSNRCTVCNCILCSNDPDSFLYKIWTPYLRAWRK